MTITRKAAWAGTKQLALHQIHNEVDDLTAQLEEARQRFFIHGEAVLDRDETHPAILALHGHQMEQEGELRTYLAARIEDAYTAGRAIDQIPNPYQEDER